MPAVLGYWKLRGLAQSIRLMLEYTGTDYTEKLYEFGGTYPDIDRSQWLDEKFNLGLAFPNLPYYIDGSTKFTQTNAILRYIARSHNLCGTTEEEIIKVDMLENQAMDMRMAWSKLVYMPNNFESEKATYIKETLPALLKPLNEFIGNNNWFTGDKITFVDFMLYEILEINKVLAPACLDDFKKLGDFVKHFESLDAIKKYIKSPQFIKYPINGPMAAFGGR